MGSVHTVDVYDYGLTNEGAFFYVMELLDGVSLDTLVKRFGSLPADRAVHLLIQVCHSLSEAHARGLIHRDIKPANIFVCRLGPDYDFAKVLDFGLVKQSVGEQSIELTADGITAGTPAFMAPEMALGKARVDGRADIYALGCVAYWLVTGRYVFEGSTPVATILEHVRSEPIPPSRRAEVEIPEALEDVIMSCLSKDPADRPQSAEVLGAVLEATSIAQSWTTDRARRWWDLHQPESLAPSVQSDASLAAQVIEVSLPRG
jgi:serine/threonine-protein kinase